MVQSYPNTSPEAAGIGSVVDEALSSLRSGLKETHSKPAAKRRNGFSSDQLYLRDKLNKVASEPLSFGGLTKLNQAWGEYEVTEAMRDASLADGLGSVYAYIQTVCSGQGSLA